MLRGLVCGLRAVRGYATPASLPAAPAGLHPLLLARGKSAVDELAELESTLNASFDAATAKRHLLLLLLVQLYEQYLRETLTLRGLEEMVSEPGMDAELVEEATADLAQLIPELAATTARLRLRLLPRHPFADKSVLLELRPGVGGLEALIFTQDLLGMYEGYAKHHGWELELLLVTPAEPAGIVEAVLKINEPGLYDRLRFESGVHRVQRVPLTEKQGRVHTSTAAVVVLPQVDEADLEIEVEIRMEDVRIDTMRAGGKGGQHVNTTDLAVRLTHLPSGIVVFNQNERLQHRNKAKAFEVLRARLAQQQLVQRMADERKMRTDQVTTTDRSDKIRTYNYVQNRVTDHRCGFTLYDLSNVVTGERLDAVVDACVEQETEQRCKELETST